eukprot:327578_1
MANQYTQGVPPNQMNPTQYQQPVIEPSMNEIMAQHQKQWQEHLSSTGTASQTTFNSNATQNTMPILPNANVPLGNMNTNMNAPMLQNQYIPPPIQPANNIIMNVVPQPSQRTLYQQQAQNYQNRSEPNLQNQTQTNNVTHPFSSQNDIHKGNAKTEEDVDHEHESFVPPAPQSTQEIKKYVNWKAKRRGIDEQKVIDVEVKQRQQRAALATEYKFESTKDVESFK